MTSFLGRKMLKNKWLMLCLILGNVILVGIVSAVPIFTEATVQRVFQEDFVRTQNATGDFPAVVQLRYDFTPFPESARYNNYVQTRDELWPAALGALNMESSFELVHYMSSNLDVRPAVARDIANSWRTLNLMGIDGFEDNVNLLRGRMPANYMVGGNVVEVLVRSDVLVGQDILLDELLYVRTLTAPNVDSGRRFYIRVVGVFDVGEDVDANAFWMATTVNLGNVMLVSSDIMRSHFVTTGHYGLRFAAYWTQVIDFNSLRAPLKEEYLESISYARALFTEPRGWTYTVSFMGILTRDTAVVERMVITLRVLQAPIFVMLALFIYMITKQI